MLRKGFRQAQGFFQIRNFFVRQIRGVRLECFESLIVIQGQTAHRTLALLDRVAAKIRREDRELAYQIEIGQARPQPRIEIVEIEISRNHREAFGDVARVEDLIQLLFGPRRGVLRAQIIEDQDRRIPDIIEALVIRFIRRRAVGGAQIIKQIRHVHKHHRRAFG